MKVFFLLLCITAAQMSDVSSVDLDSLTDYDEDLEYHGGMEGEVYPVIDPRGHRPTSGHGDRPLPSLPKPAGRPTYDVARKRTSSLLPVPEKQAKISDEIEVSDQGGCMHLSSELCVMCPTGCVLRTDLLKQERDIKPVITSLQSNVSSLSRSSHSIQYYVEKMDKELERRRSQYTGNNYVVESYSTELEERFILIKDTMDRSLPSTIRMMRSIVDSFKEKLLKLERALETQKGYCKDPCVVSCNIPAISGKDCDEIRSKGGDTSQLYLIQPDSSQPYKVFCDMTTDMGGWTLIQNRKDGSVDFGRTWDDYKKGFGNIAFDVGKGYCDTPGEYWLGNDRISRLTKLRDSELLFEMSDWKDNKVTASYRKFLVQNEVGKYRLTVDGYSGTAGNTLMDGAKTLYGYNRTMTIHKDMMFSTFDRDNDGWIPGDVTKQCAREDGGGWWYNRCHSANPNGRYYWGGGYTREMAKHGTDDGIVWMDWKGSWYSLKKMSMKIRTYLDPSAHGMIQQSQSFQ
ncbi:fibrinogen beta chain precursor [Callorhinchus milii]|uniref:Fibrinogen beta chain n=1 Tax=Callorhinchus milii TaxID=7868 RepID=K4GHX1_CALMI|nr:fibrinogen beta chain precursor [Callorhinchus milii]AFM90361.1 fibrinogen beta chain [Callorhinchus milii]AFM90423.1 fibrinogen beta chain [Callorhinchus milii]|eukprot:gi/632982089/ref/XP_007907945.1/ PREDICTED: fibrinogen beta chain [Callorhinchus milii]